MSTSLSSNAPSKAQWTAIGGAAAVMVAVTGPVGAALTAAGATAGTYLANAMRWPGSDSSPSS